MNFRKIMKDIWGWWASKIMEIRAGDSSVAKQLPRTRKYWVQSPMPAKETGFNE